MNTYQFYSMTNEKAMQISNWKYKEPYTIYSMDDSEECISELLNGDYFYVQNPERLLVGFICSANSARVSGGYAAGIYNDSKFMDIGIGLTPDLTGLGKGQEILSDSIWYLKEHYKVNDFQLVVAEFNLRAIKVYERVGFVRGMSFESKVNNQEVNFVVMNYSIPKSQRAL